jgi:hypothetical protein
LDIVCAANCALEALADSIPSCRFMINQIRLTLNSVVLQRVRHISPSHFYGFCLSKIESLESMNNQSTSLRDQSSLTPRRFPAKQDSLEAKDLHERNRAILKEAKTNKSDMWKVNMNQKPKSLQYRKLKANAARILFDKLYNRNYQVSGT